MSAFTTTRPPHIYHPDHLNPRHANLPRSLHDLPASYDAGDSGVMPLNPNLYLSASSASLNSISEASRAPIGLNGSSGTNGTSMTSNLQNGVSCNYADDKQPNWNEFYKNGKPSEKDVIVIDDTPEPQPQPQPQSHTRTNGQALQGSDRTPLSATQPAKKRRIEEISTATRANTRQNGKPKAGLSNGTAREDASSADMTAGQKRKRQKYSPPSPVGHFDKLLGRNFEDYSGPVRQVKRTRKDVYLRAASLDPKESGKKVNDDDGHYIVVPNARLTRKYEIHKLLGQGTFGKVVRATDRDTNELVAVKVIRSVQKYRDAARIELRVLQTLRHNDVANRFQCIHLRDCFEFCGHTCLVTDLLDKSLFDFLKENAYVPFPKSHIQSFAKQLLTSVAFIHDIGLIHTDLKPENILLKNASFQPFTYDRPCPQSRKVPPRTPSQRRVLYNPDIRLIDFGSATFEDEYHSTVVSTRHYRAPEIIMGLGWSFPCDIWSIACILVEFFTGDALFQTHDNLEHLAIMEEVFGQRIDADMVRRLNKIAPRGNSSATAAVAYFKRLKLNWPTQDTTRASIKFVKSMKPLQETIPSSSSFLRSFVDLLQKMFVYDPEKRITAKEALKHPWFRERINDDGTEAARLYRERKKPGADRSGSERHE